MIDAEILEIKESPSPTNDYNYIMDIMIVHGWWAKLFGRPDAVKVSVKGKCHIWYLYPSGEEVTTDLESKLAQLIRRYENMRTFIKQGEK